MKHCLTYEEFDFLIRRESIIVADSVIEKICGTCVNEPICGNGIHCEHVRKTIIQDLKNKTSEELTHLVINKRLYTF